MLLLQQYLTATSIPAHRRLPLSLFSLLCLSTPPSFGFPGSTKATTSSSSPTTHSPSSHPPSSRSRSCNSGYRSITETDPSSGTTALNSMRLWEEGRELALAKCIPPLSLDSHKGSSGRLAVLGGSAQYTGAPFYTAMASLQAGTDLAYVMTAQEAALPIKCYSPELMVAPVYTAAVFDRLVADNETDSEQAQIEIDRMVQMVLPMLDRLHCLVVGPGLGRCPLVLKAVAQILVKARARDLHMVLDADALYMLSLPEYRNLLRGYDKVVLTPNVVEYKRLFQKHHDSDDPEVEEDNPFASAVIVQKGRHDVIYFQNERVYVCEEQGGLKRSGGIGDVLSGTVGTLVAWHAILQQQREQSETSTTSTSEASDVTIHLSDLPLACWTACCFVKRATKHAFEAKKRAMTAPDVLDQLGSAIDSMTRTDSSAGK